MEMKNMRTVGMLVGVIGGCICILGGLLCILLGLIATQGTSTLPPGLYWAIGFYFIGKGMFLAGISVNVADRPAA